MHRSQETKLSSSSTTLKAAGGEIKKKSLIEQAYGVSLGLGKPKTNTSISNSSKTPTTGQNKTLNAGPTKRGPPTAPNLNKKQSPLVAASKAKYAAQNQNAKVSAPNPASQLKKPPIMQKKSSLKNSGGGVAASQKRPNPNAAKVTKSPSPQQTKEVDYEDDFEEDYPSDFEEVDSTDSEDLGHEDEFLVEKAKAAALARENKIKEAIIQDDEEESTIKELENLEKLIMVEDQEEEAKEDDTESSEEDCESKEEVLEEPNKQLINASKSSLDLQRESIRISGKKIDEMGDMKSIQRKETSAVASEGRFNFAKSIQAKGRMSRGVKLMGMIRFDKYYRKLLEIESSSELFMYTLSGTRRIQQSNQTEKDALEESVQTEEIQMTSKWTQKPPTWSSSAVMNCDVQIIRQEALGVGSESLDSIGESKDSEQKIDVFKNWQQLSKFISRASKKVLYVLESQKRINLPKTSNGDSEKKENMDGEIKMNRGLSVLSKLEMGCLTLDGDFVACSNGHPSKDKRKHTSKNIITIWSLKEPSSPMYFLRAWGQVTSLKVYPLGHLAIAGNNDGTISLWDLDESNQYHSQYQEQLIRTTSVSTSCMETSHLDRIVGISAIPESSTSTGLASIVLSMDKVGTMMIWVCRRVITSVPDEVYSRYSSAWSKIHLSLRQKIDLREQLKEPLLISDFCAWKDEEASAVGFAISTMNGYALRGLLGDEETMAMQKYEENVENNSPILCFDLSLDLNVILTGCVDKHCRLYDFNKRKLILSLPCEEAPIKVKWSKIRCSLFYVVMNEEVAVWDILVSDLTPWKVIKIKAVQGFALYTTQEKEFTVILASNELKISSLGGEVRPLSSRDRTRIQTYVALHLS